MDWARSRLGKRSRPADERGAVLAMVAVLLVVLVSSAAFAVDLAAIDRRGQQLQSVADAAALGSVAVWANTGDVDKSVAAATDLMVANGLEGDVRLDIGFPGPDQVWVSLHDETPERFFGALTGFGKGVERDATAQLSTCNVGCGASISIPPPTDGLPGTGESFEPQMINGKLYSLQPGGDQIWCVDLISQENCWGQASRDAVLGAILDRIPRLEVLAGKLWFTAQTASDFSLYCWDPAIDQRCGSHALITSRPSAEQLGNLRAVRGGGLAVIGERLFVYTDDEKVHCFLPDGDSASPCDGYDGGLTANPGGPQASLDPVNGNSGSGIDRLVDPSTGRVIWAIPKLNPDLGLLAGVRIRCWDANTDSTCSLFLFDEQYTSQVDMETGRIFGYRAPSGVLEGFCVTSFDTGLTCTPMNGYNWDPLGPAIESEMSWLRNRVLDLPLADLNGVFHWNAASNRLFMPSPSSDGRVACWDFVNAQQCGQAAMFGTGVDVKPHGFWSDGACIYGRGAAGPTGLFGPDLAPACLNFTFEHTMYACSCSGEPLFPNPEFNIDPADYSQFDVTVYGQDGSVAIATQSILDPDNDVLDLSGVDNANAWITLGFEISALDPEAFATGGSPLFEAGFKPLPVLIE